MSRPKPTDPVLVELPPRTMAVLCVTGDPSEVLPKVMPALYGAVYTLKFALKKAGQGDFKVGPLVARWPNAHLVPREEWTALYGLPVPEGTKEVTPKVPGLAPVVEVWEYGTVAQLLHLGPYSTEGPTVQRLHEFIAASGYEICGDHEEEYLTSPGAKVQKTIIRYPVRQRD